VAQASFTFSSPLEFSFLEPLPLLGNPLTRYSASLTVRAHHSVSTLSFTLQTRQPSDQGSVCNVETTRQEGHLAWRALVVTVAKGDVVATADVDVVAWSSTCSLGVADDN